VDSPFAPVVGVGKNSLASGIIKIRPEFGKHAGSAPANAGRRQSGVPLQVLAACSGTNLTLPQSIYIYMGV